MSEVNYHGHIMSSNKLLSLQGKVNNESNLSILAFAPETRLLKSGQEGDLRGRTGRGRKSAVYSIGRLEEVEVQMNLRDIFMNYQA